MHHLLIVLTVTFIQGQCNLNHENNGVLLFQKLLKAIPITFAVKMYSPPKGRSRYSFLSPMTEMDFFSPSGTFKIKIRFQIMK